MEVTSRGELEGPVVFDCPVCGVHHDGRLQLEMATETEGWELGNLQGPQVDLLRRTPAVAFIRQAMRTSACPDVFVTRSITDEPTFEVTLTTYSDGHTPTLLRVVPREVESDGV